jgi:hypothetical protein
MDFRPGPSYSEITAERVAERLGLGDAEAEWLAKLEGAHPSSPMTMPATGRLIDLVEQLEVPVEDRAKVLDNMPDPDRDPERWWLLERSHHFLAHDLVSRVRQTGPPPPTPPRLLPEGLSFFSVHLILVTINDILNCHQKIGVPEEVSRETLSLLGRRMASYRAVQGRTGIELSGWDWMRFFGLLYQVGRLEVIPYRLCTHPEAGPLFWYDDETITRRGRGFRRGDPALSIHVPPGDPLNPQACHASFARLQTAFNAVQPDEPPLVATCTSWLLDDQLSEYLPADSNILRFARRFELVPGSLDSDEAVLHNVFGAGHEKELDALPQRTTLERAVVEHIRSGRHWRLRTGWLSLAPQPQASDPFDGST